MCAFIAEVVCHAAPLANLLQELESSSGAAAYGVFVLILVLGTCLVPIPEEAAFAIGGALAARGHLSGVALYALGWSTLLLLDLTLHTLGRRVGGDDIAELPLARRLGPRRWQRLRLLVARRGVLGVAGARFVMGTRIPVFLLAGALGMPRGRFLAVVATAGLFSAGLPLLLGYLFGAHLDALLEALGHARWLLLIGALLLLGVWWASRARP